MDVLPEEVDNSDNENDDDRPPPSRTGPIPDEIDSDDDEPVPVLLSQPQQPRQIAISSQMPQVDRDRAILLEIADKYEKFGITRANELLQLYNLDYTIDTDLKSDLGMVVVNNQTNKATVVFRGTIPYYRDDLVFDVQLYLNSHGSHDQQRRARELLHRADDKYIVEACTGYSKGGAHCLDFAGGINVDSTIFNPAFARDQYWNTSIFGQRETSQQNVGFFDQINPFSHLYSWANSINNMREGGYRNKINVYRTQYDPVSAGLKLVDHRSHPNVNVNTILPTNINVHEIDNFYDRRH